MNKAELVAAMAQESGLSVKNAEQALNAFTDTISKELAGGNEVKVVGFGTFSTTKRAARTGVKPGTNEKIAIPASIAPKFKASKALKDAVN